MQEITKKQITCHSGNLRVILQFPDEPRDTSAIQKEVKAILYNELQEQFRKRL